MDDNEMFSPEAMTGHTGERDPREMEGEGFVTECNEREKGSPPLKPGSVAHRAMRGLSLIHI